MRRPARPAGYRGRGTPRWSHLMADTLAELAAFARRLGLNPAWIQHEGRPTEHYDVTDTVRTRALQLGAVRLRYGRESGLYTSLKLARTSGDATRIDRAEQALAAARTEDRAPRGWEAHAPVDGAKSP
jgi:hypothetical protein